MQIEGYYLGKWHDIAKKLPNKTMIAKKTWPVIRKSAQGGGEGFWTVDARLNGKGKRYSCPTKDEAKALAEQLRIRRMNSGTSAFTMPDNERIDAQTALDRLRPHGFTLMESVSFFLKHVEVIQRDVSLQFLIDEMHKANTQDGYALDTLHNRRRIYKRFAADHASAKVLDITSAGVESWLRTLPIGGLSRNTYRGQLGTLFGYAVKRKYILSNPIKDVSEARVIDKEPGILSTQAAQRLLEVVPEGILPLVVLGLFAGLRPQSEAIRLRWEHLNFGESLIDIAADRTKTSQKRFVTMTDALLAWLLPIRKKSGPIYGFTFSYYKQILSAARRKANIPHWPADALRHTYGSMHFAYFKDSGLTAQQMGHQSSAMLFKHYRARVTPEEAAAFWNLRPGQESNIVQMVA